MKKPGLNLKVLEEDVVNVKNFEEWKELMRIYELGGWKMGRVRNEDSPLQKTDDFQKNKNGLCVTAGISSKFWIKGINTSGRKEHYKRKNIISVEEFYEKQDITAGNRYEIQLYFDTSPKFNNVKIKEKVSLDKRDYFEFFSELGGVGKTWQSILDENFNQRVAYTMMPVLLKYKSLLENSTLNEKRKERLDLVNRVLKLKQN